MLNPFSVEKESNPTRLDFLPNQIPYPDFTREANYGAFPKENSNSFLFEDKLNNDSNEIKLEDNLFQNGRIDSKESTETMFDFALQKRFKDSLPDSLQKDYFPEKIKRNFTNICFLPFFHLMDQNITPSLFEIRHIILSVKPIKENTSVSTGETSIKPPNNVSNQTETKKFIQKKRRKIKGPRKGNSDNMRVKIKRCFYRNLKKKLNNILKKSGSRKYFDFFPSKFSSEINKKNFKIIVNMTLNEIFLDKNLYKNENEDGLRKYKHNSNVVKSEEVSG